MKTNRTHLFLALLFTAFIISCSSDDDEDEVAPAAATLVETNTPPSGNYYSGVFNDDFGSFAAWTTDFVTISKFTGEFSQVYNVKVENDTILIAYSDIHQLHYIAYAPVNNLTDFKVLTSREPIREFSILNGVIIVYAVDGLNKYTGYSNVNQAMTSVQYISNLSPTVEFSGFTNTGSAVIANHQDNSARNMAYTTDGLTWIVSGTVSGGRFEVFDGKTWRFGGSSFDYTNDSDLSSATWTNTLMHLDSLNTTDSSGWFRGSYLDVNSAPSWRYYGRIFNGITAHPVLNISNDQGVTWETQFLSSIQSVDDNSDLEGEYYSINSLTIWKNTSTHYQFPIGIYTAANGIDFTFDGNQATLDQFNKFWNTNFVR